ncbi:ABC transporter substrate-binding protein [Pigmentiphaga soli]|uniref:ABC transporter substrate-binding protein n=1 Tax=Pigmentiphaga soli TaxID=1007095 RepID=A0ABP8GGL7_9BURK
MKGAGAGIAVSFGSALGIASVARAAAPQAEDTLVISGVGGSTQRLIETQIFPQFSRTYGVKRLIYIAGNGSELLAKYRTERNRPSIDVAWVTSETTVDASRDGLLAQFDEALIPNAQAIPASMRSSPTALPVGVNAVGLLYNTEIFAEKGLPPPDSWLSLWKPEFKGHAGILTIGNTGAKALVAMLAHILTGDQRNLDAALDRLSALRPNLMDVFSSPGALDSAFQQRDVWLAPQVALRALQFRRAGVPIGFARPKEGFTGYRVETGVIKGAPHPKAAHAWIDYLLQAETQLKLERLLGYGPIRPDIQIDEDLKSYFPPATEVFSPDWSYLAEHRKALFDGWNQRVERQR